jgi:DNA-binding MurR/RpiR family transcriptional regulator
MAGIEERLKEGWGGLTASEQRIAAWFLAHLGEAPFETAASIGAQVGVSPMTVGRYIRKLGYGNLKDIKAELRAGAAENGGPHRPSSRATFEPASLKAKVEGLESVYALPKTFEWRRIVTRIATASRVHVASFAAGRFLGIGFVAMLQNLRPGVVFSDGADAYADILLDPAPGACLVLIDVRRYSRHFRLLAEEAAARGVPTIIITDVYCHWARAATPDVLMIETEFGIRSLSMAQALFELLLGAVAGELEGTEERFEAIHALRRKFGGPPDDPSPRRR